MKFNTKESPCEASDGYRFAMCLENRILSQVGCQPFWIERKLEPALPPCQNATQFDEILEKYDLLQQLALDDLIADSECLMPCAFMKYEVKLHNFNIEQYLSLGHGIIIDGVSQPHSS